MLTRHWALAVRFEAKLPIARRLAFARTVLA